MLAIARHRSLNTRRWDLWVLAALTLALNVPLLFGVVPVCWVFHPGDWWRGITHAFVHVSLYHLLLDAGAFLMLYATLQQRRFTGRLLAFTLSAAGSLAAVLWTRPDVAARGLCGLSGAAHGLMAYAGLEMMRDADRTTRRIGLAYLGVVVGKSMVEAITGNVVFAFLHLGYVGMPFAVSHAGGALGGILAFGLAAYRTRRAVRYSSGVGGGSPATA